MPQRAPNREKTGSLWDAFLPSSRRRRRLPRLPGQWLRRTSIAGWVILLAVLVLLARLGGRGPTPEPPIAPLDTGEVRVGRVIDGDTLELSDGTKVRLIGVDTPELARAGRPAEPFAHEAARFTEQFLSQGPVRLELDPYERAGSVRSAPRLCVGGAADAQRRAAAGRSGPVPGWSLATRK
jgi:endonuclease YncB( thermonuclease family)